LKSRKPSRFDPICFHCQQCAEKYIKGRLTEANILFPKTHDLGVVLNLAVPIEPLWSVFSPGLLTISTWGVLPRYPGNSATSHDARHAVKVCRNFRAAARSSLGLN